MQSNKRRSEYSGLVDTALLSRGTASDREYTQLPQQKITVKPVYLDALKKVI